LSFVSLSSVKAGIGVPPIVPPMTTSKHDSTY
jgi:hypothetical protein